MAGHGAECKGTYGVLCLNCGERVDVSEAGEQVNLVVENVALKERMAEVAAAHFRVRQVEEENAALRELCQRAYENLDDDIENKPMRHSCGNLIANLRAALAGKFDWRR